MGEEPWTAPPEPEELGEVLNWKLGPPRSFPPPPLFIGVPPEVDIADGEEGRSEASVKMTGI